MKEQEVNLKDEIRVLLGMAEGGHNAYKLICTKDGNTSYYLTSGPYKGVGFEIDESFKEFKYDFASIKINVEEKNINGKSIYMIQLLSDKIYDTNEFIYICIKFIEAGYNNENRNLILSNPQEWVDKWKILFGNKNQDEKAYPFLGELISLKYLIKNGKNPKLTNKGSHDIETTNENYEVKTSIVRHSTLIEIHSKNQLAKLNNNDLYLHYIKLEESVSGISIASIVKDLEKLNYDISNIKEKIKEFNFETLNKCYKIDEIREYKVDESFPKIVNESFVDGHLPLNIKSITYVVDLDGITYKNIESNFI